MANPTYDAAFYVKQKLAVSLASALTTEGLPAMNEYVVGVPARLFAPTMQLPRLYVEPERWSQEEIQLNRKMERRTTLGVWFGYDHTDPGALSVIVYKVADLISEVVEEVADPSDANRWIEVESADFSPAVPRGGDVLHQFGYVRLIHYADRDRGGD